MSERITFTKQDDGTFLKEGKLDSNGRVQLRIGNDNPFGNYSVAEAEKFFAEAIAKGQMKHDRYSIVPTDAPAPKEEAKPRETTQESTTAAKEPQAPKAAGKKPRLDVEKVKAVYAENKSVGQTAKALGASYMGVRLVLIRERLLRP